MSCSHTSPGKTATASEMPTVRVNGQLIAEDAIGRELQHHPADTAELALKNALEALIIKEVLVQKAKALELKNSDKDLDEKEIEALISQLLDQEIETPKADEKSCQQYYDSNKEKFRSPDLIEASHILLAAAPDDVEARDKMKQQALELIEKLKLDTQQFAELARAYSACPSKETGGNLGQLSKGSTVPEFERQVFTLPEGLCENPVESRYGYHVIWVNHRVDGEQLPFDIVQDKIVTYLDQRVYRKAVSQYIQILMNEAEIEGIELEEGSALVQ